MANPASYRPASGEIPTTPGVYRFQDEHGRVIYVGKAINLRSRLNSYFASPATLAPKTYAMVHDAASVQWTLVGSELEALQLEYTWIKEFTPRYNLMFRDDKSYPYLAVTMGEEFPRVQIMRGDRRKGIRYFGPYTAGAIRDTMDALLRVIPVRSCSKATFNRAQRSGRPCLLGYIGKCSAPCVGWVSPEEHRVLAEDFCAVMASDGKKIITERQREMTAAASSQDYERAARLRDEIEALRKTFERNTVVLSEETEADIFAVAEDELEAAVQVFHIRGGRIRSQRGWVVEKVEEISQPEFLEHLVQQVYGSESEDRIPRQILLPELPTQVEQLQSWLSGLRGAQVEIKVPQRGGRATLLATVTENAEQALKLHKSRRVGDLNQRSQSLKELQEALGMDQPLLRIECFDISHSQGTNVVASMVVFEDGLAKKSDYRRFAITGDAARDDTASMYDVISRRFRRYQQESQQTQQNNPIQQPSPAQQNGPTQQNNPAPSGEITATEITDQETLPEKPAKFAYPPSLLVVDGGPPQVAAAARALQDVGVTGIALCGLAKRLEEVWLPEDEFPVILPRASQGLYLLQRVRDEAHRFAISFHRAKRSKSMTASLLEEVPGLGEVKRKALLKHFGSLKKIQAAIAQELQEAPGIGPQLAQAIQQTLQQQATESASENEGSGLTVNMSTGEILA